MRRTRAGHGSGTVGSDYRWSELDRRSRKYLRAAWSHRGHFSSGVVIPVTAGGRSPWPPAACAVGALGLAVALWHMRGASTLSPVLHGVLFVASVLLLVGSAVHLRATWRTANLGSFTLCDPLRVWGVSPPFVSVTARECTEYLNAVAQASGDDWTEIGVQAVARARGTQSGRSPTRVPPPLRAARGSTRESAAAASQRRFAIALGGAFVASTLGALFILPPARERTRDDHAYKLAQHSPRMAETESCLRAYPGGRHFTEVRALRDHRRYELAKEASARDRSPAPLRAYLADSENTLHRIGAKKRIDRLRFDRAQAEAKLAGSPAPLRAYLADPAGKRHRATAREVMRGIYDAALKPYEKSSKTNKQADTELVKGLVALVWNSRRATDPCVRVRFKRSYEVHPTYPSVELALAVNRLILIEPRQSFYSKQIEKREEMLLGRFAAAVDCSLGPGLVTFREVAGEEQPDLEFLYTVSASFTELYVSSGGRFAVINAGRTGGFREILHKYAINCTIVIHDRKRKAEYRTRVYGGPDGSITVLDSEVDDPQYMAMIESAFDNFATRLVKKLCLAEPAAEKDKPEAVAKR